MKRFNITTLLVFLLSGFTSYAQQLDSLLFELGTKYPQEKVYIQYDKPYYNPGETVWFKGYITSDNLASSISKTLYAELINEKGKVLQKKIMPVIESGAASFFDLPDTLSASVVYVRAYTSWMLNFDPSLLYVKPISIITSSAKKAVLPPSYTLTFFPEGGDLVNSVESLVAFKATDQSGNPINITGDIVNDKGKKLLSFESVHNGMGTFAFTPSKDETYKATWKDKKGILHETALPAAKEQGVVLSVVKTKNHLIYNLKRPAITEPAFTSFTIIGQMQQLVVYSARVNMTSKMEVTASVPIDSLPTGVLQLTIFNASQIPVAERICFINQNNYSFITDLHAIQLDLNKRKHNTLQVDVGGRIVSNLSISVTDEGLSTVPANRDNIYSNLLLSSDLKGYVYNPAYYFSSEEDSVAQQLDLVMLTNGWRRFKWEDVIAGKWPVITHEPDDFISIIGKVFGPSPSLLKEKEITGVLKTKTSDDFFSMPINQDGKFGLTGVTFFDSAKLYYQFNQDKDKQLTAASTFSIKSNFASASPASVSFLNTLYPPPSADSSMAGKNKKITKLIQQDFAANNIKSLENVTVKTKIKTLEQKLDEKYTSGFFTGGDAYVFPIADDPTAITAPTILDYLKSRVAGLMIGTKSTSGSVKADWRGSKTIFFLNETTTEIDRIQDIPMIDVAMIKVFRPPFFSASGGGAGGAVAVYLKKGSENNSQFKGLDFVKLNGYSTIREFYVPDYEKLADNAPLNDYRSTLYWNPFLMLDKETRRIKIPFYNSDNCKKIRVIIEGLNSEGKLTREEKVFQ